MPDNGSFLFSKGDQRDLHTKTILVNGTAIAVKC